MKLKITRSDGVIIELEGTTEEVKAVIGDVLPAQAFTISYPQTVPFTWGDTSSGFEICQHEYPPIWNGIGAPVCLKCGR